MLETPGRETVFAGRIEGGEIYNQAPTTCRVSGTRRWTRPGSAENAVRELRNLAAHWEDDNNDLHRYYLALFFEAILRIVGDVRDSPSQPSSMWQRSHALMRTAVIIEWFKEQEKFVII